MLGFTDLLLQNCASYLKNLVKYSYVTQLSSETLSDVTHQNIFLELPFLIRIFEKKYECKCYSRPSITLSGPNWKCLQFSGSWVVSNQHFAFFSLAFFQTTSSCGPQKFINMGTQQPQFMVTDCYNLVTVTAFVQT